jgi:ADP-heptose:LPS heptosyltransferase/GT2 family glycosyltransferase
VAYLFGEYELLAKSGLFDDEYYLRVYPDVADLNIDPLMHYLEWGCHERRDPGAYFDTSHYLSQCKALGEMPANALFHYLTVGVKRGLTPTPHGQPIGQHGGPIRASPRARGAQSQPGDDPPASMLYLDIPRIVQGAADAPVRGGLSIVGWSLVSHGVAAVDIALDGQRVTGARCGLRRPDVAAAHPTWEGALLSGYAAHLPPKALAVGRHQVTVSLREDNELAARMEFQIEVQAIPDDRGPWALRHKMSQAEVDLKLSALKRLDWRPLFRVVLPLVERDEGFAKARRTLAALSRQTYPDWELWVISGDAKTKDSLRRRTLHSELIAGFEGIAQRIRILEGRPIIASGDQRQTPADANGRSFAACLAPGDEFGCDALLEFALASGFAREAELLYCDERRSSLVDSQVEAFFKPAWSPDLLLSTNYIGRAWYADMRLIERAGLTLGELCDLSTYEVTLRLTEAAQSIHHIPKVLYERGNSVQDSAEQERRALAGALKRRKIAGVVRAGLVAGHYRVKRKLQPERVSIIIPTCAADGLIKTCLETLRARTVYRDYEIICIENIPKQQQHWKRWLRAHADLVIQAGEPFNWSRYNNRAAERAAGKYLLFLNDDIEIIDPEWLEALLEQAQRPEVGVVGARLLYPDRSVQHGGVMLDRVGRGLHAFRHLPENDPGYFGLALTQRNVISVTGACLLTRRETFDALGRFDEAHAVINNDLDYCLRAWRKGLLNVYTPYARLIHHELASRSDIDEYYDAKKFRKRWRRVIMLGDPYFNPNLSREHEVFTIEREPVENVYAGHPLFARASVHRILIVKLDHIGDCITALPALRRLKQLFPAARISVLAARATHSIWKSEPLIEEVIEFNIFHARSGSGKLNVTEHAMQALDERLRAKKFDLAIDLRKQPDTRHVLQHTGAHILVGFDHQGRFPWLDVALEWDEDVPLRTKHGHVADDLSALVEAVATHSDADRGAVLTAPVGPLVLPDAEKRGLFSKPLICIHPAAGSPMRQWPPEKYSELIELLLDEKDFNIALIGGEDESEIAAKVLDRTDLEGQVFNLLGKLGLEDLPKLLAKAALFVGNNSGPQHLAAALGIPTIGIHSGVVDAREWGPLGPNAVAVRREMSCSPCFIEQPKDCPRALVCLTELDVISVFNSSMQMLARPNRRARSDRDRPRPSVKPAVEQTDNDANRNSNDLSADSKATFAKATRVTSWVGGANKS